MTNGINVTVGMLKSVIHQTTNIEYADFFTCEEIYDPADNRQVVSVSIVRDKIETLFVFIA